MTDKDVYKKFIKAQKYRIYGSIFLIISILTIFVLGKNVTGYIFTILFLSIGFFCETQYKCPVCKTRFDPRIQPSKLIYCPKCSVKLQ